MLGADSPSSLRLRKTGHKHQGLQDYQDKKSLVLSLGHNHVKMTSGRNGHDRLGGMKISKTSSGKKMLKIAGGWESTTKKRRKRTPMPHIQRGIVPSSDRRVVFCYYRCSITNDVDIRSLKWVGILCAVPLDMVFLLDPACSTTNTDHNTSKYVALSNH